MIDRLLEALRPLFGTWGYLIVAVGAMLENSIGVGLIIPGETFVLMGGFYAALGVLSPILVVAVAAVGQAVGDLAGYALGRSAGRKLGKGYETAGRSVGAVAAVALAVLGALIAGSAAWRWWRARQPER